MNVHPAAGVFPMLPANELKALAEDIQTHGQLQPIVLTENGTLLDGRNRLAACELMGIAPVFVRIHFDTPVDEIDFIVSVNVRRRHLDTSQKAMIAAGLLPMFEAAAKERMLSGKAEEPCGQLATGSTDERKSREQAARAVGVSGRTVQRAKRVANEAPELVDDVIAGKIKLGTIENQLAEAKERNERRTERLAKNTQGFAEAEEERNHPARQAETVWLFQLDRVRGYAHALTAYFRDNELDLTAETEHRDKYRPELAKAFAQLREVLDAIEGKFLRA